MSLQAWTACLLFIAAPARAAGPVVAVFDLENRAKLKADDADVLTEYVATKLASGGRYRVVPKSEVQSALRAKKAESYRACYDESCQIEVGRELAAQKSLSTKVSRLGSTCIVTVQLYDLAQSATEGAGTSRGGCKVEEVLALLDEAMAPFVAGKAPVITEAPKAVPVEAAPVETPKAAPVEAPKAEAPKAAAATTPPAASTRGVPPEVLAAPMPTPPASFEPIDALVFQRSWATRARARALLVTEIQGLERLYERTPAGAQDLPTLQFRLARAYGELEAAARRDKASANASAKDKAAQIERAARKKQIEHLRALIEKHPSYGKRDNAIFDLAAALQRDGDLRGARTTYYALIKEHPASADIPAAYAAFGCMFAAEQKFDLARQAFDEVTKYPRSAVSAYAYYRLAWIHAAAHDRESALASLWRARERARQLADDVTWKAELLRGVSMLP